MPLQTLPTQTLLDHAAAGDAAAVEALGERLLPRLNIWAAGKLPSHARSVKDTCDIVLDAFNSSVANIHKDWRHGHKSFLQYIKRAIENQIRSELRLVRNRQEFVEPGESLPDPGPTPLDQFLESEDQRRYEAALERLDPSDRELIIAKLELDMSYQEIALHAGKPSADAARVAIRRAIQRLEKELKNAERPRGPDPP
jgi:RNA polymerase sigma factor (sigma-70 family)